MIVVVVEVKELVTADCRIPVINSIGDSLSCPDESRAKLSCWSKEGPEEVLL